MDNLDEYGLDLKEFAHEIQIAIQCSCTVSQSSSNKTQVVIQGNQIAYVADLLTGNLNKTLFILISGVECNYSTSPKSSTE